MKQLNPNSVVRARNKHVFCELDGEAVILQVDTGTYFGLNTVGHSVWSYVQEPQTFDRIVNKILEEYDVSRTECEQDIHKLISDMYRAGLIDVEDGSGQDT